MATEAEVQQDIIRVQTQRENWVRTMAALRADANADTTRRRGRRLPDPIAGGDQLPAQGVVVTEIQNRKEGDTYQRLVPADDVAWQNLANHLAIVNERGLHALRELENALGAILADLRAPARGRTPGAPPPDPAGDAGKLPPWVDYISDIIAYVVVFYGLVVAAQAFSLFTIFVGVGLLALTGLLQAVIINPIRSAIRIVFGTIIEIIVEIVQFVAEWLRATIEYFQGNFVKMILRVVILAAFAWIFKEAMKIPAFHDTIEWIGTSIKNVVQFVNNLFDSITKAIEWVRGQIRDVIGNTFSSLGDWGKYLSDALLGQVDRLFTGLERRVQQLRFAILERVDLITAAMSAQITVFGIKVGLLPDEIRVYLRHFYQAQPRQALENTAEIVALAGAGLGTGAAELTPPWTIADDLDREMRTTFAGGTNEIAAIVAQFSTSLREAFLGKFPETPPIPKEWLQILPAEIRPPIPQPPVGRPAFISEFEWAQVQGQCGFDHVAYVVAAIGQHETRWGREGAGRNGFVLGVGVWGGQEREQFKGLTAQLAFMCPKLRTWFPTPADVSRDTLIAFAAEVQRPNNPVAWGTDVFDIYAQIAFPSVPTHA